MVNVATFLLMNYPTAAFVLVEHLTGNGESKMTNSFHLMQVYTMVQKHKKTEQATITERRRKTAVRR